MIYVLYTLLVVQVLFIVRVEWVHHQRNKLINDIPVMEYTPIDSRYTSYTYMVVCFWIWDVNKFKLDTDESRTV